MLVLDVIFYLYLLPMCVVLLPIVFAPNELDESDEISRVDIFILAVLPILNLYSAISMIDIITTSIIIYIKRRFY